MDFRKEQETEATNALGHQNWTEGDWKKSFLVWWV